MYSSAAKRNRGRQGRFVPRVEALEDRLVPAVNAPVVIAPGVVVFSATPASSGSNTLNIFDDGVGDIKFNTSSTGSGSQSSLPKGTGPIHEIIYAASTGTDVLNYKMLNNATLLEKMQVVVLLPHAGNKGFTANFGTPFKPGTAGAPGVPAVPGTQPVPVNVGGDLDVSIFGSPNKNNATLVYAGTVTGHLTTQYRDPQLPMQPHAHALAGSKVSFTLNLEPHSTGHVHPKILGGIGDDSLTLFVIKVRPSDPVRIDGAGALNGGGGVNSGSSALPITEVNIQS
jgi:hypothetical protein